MRLIRSRAIRLAMAWLGVALIGAVPAVPTMAAAEEAQAEQIEVGDYLEPTMVAAQETRV